MDYDSSTKFISSLAKFLQSLCNGYVEFDNGVQVIGHLYLNVDTGKTIDYVLNEKVCKTDENSVTFISNSFHAQPAEKPKPPGKNRDTDKSDLKPEAEGSNQTELRGSNAGTLSSSRNQSSNSPQVGAKRPLSPSKSESVKSGRVSPRNKRSRPAIDSKNNGAHSGSENIESISKDSLYQQSLNHEASSFNESYQQNFFTGDENSNGDGEEQRDIKPTFDTDITFIKEEYAPSSLHSENQAMQDDGMQGESSSGYPHSYSNQQFHPGGYADDGSFNPNQRSTFNPSGFNPGNAQMEGSDVPNDPSGISTRHAPSHFFCLGLPSYPLTYSAFGPSEAGSVLTCKKCGEVFHDRNSFIVHLDVCRAKRIECPECKKVFRRSFNLRVHRRSIHGVGEKIVCNKCGLTFRSFLKLNEHMSQCSDVPSQ